MIGSIYNTYTGRNSLSVLPPSSAAAPAAPTTLPSALFGSKLAPTLAIPPIVHGILQCIDPATWQALPFVNKAWYRAVQGKTFLLRFSQDEQIHGQQDRYTVKRSITREESQAILRQTGIEIPFAPGQELLPDFTLGRGNFGEFCIGYAAQRAHFVGIKITRGAHASEREALLQQSLNGFPSVIPTLDLCKAVDASGSKTLYQVMDLAGLGSSAKLKPQLSKISDQNFKEQILFCLAEGLLVGLAKMHAAGFYHLDIKPDNLVVRQDGQVFIIDFGCSAHSSTGFVVSAEENGDRRYFSPERWLAQYKGIPERCAADKIDGWAVGMALLVLAMPKLDFAADTEWLFFEEVQAIVDANQPVEQISRNLQQHVQGTLARIPVLNAPPSDSYWSLVRGLLAVDPIERLSPVQALHHPWFERMAKASSVWRQATLDYLREMVQASQRETRATQEPGATFSPLSPQDLPLPHFASFVERPQLQQMLLKTMLGGNNYDRELSVFACQGMGGVGKTQLMTYLLHHPQVQTHFGLKLWFRSSDSKGMVATQCLFLARELRLVDDKASLDVALRELHTYLALYPKRFGKPWLAVFDNAEDPALLAPYLPPCGGQVVVTTRSALWKGAIPVDVLAPEEGTALVHKLLQGEDPQSEALCKELGYLPLALMQACAYIRNQQLTSTSYLEQLHKTTTLLVSDERLYGKKLPSSLMTLWQMTFTTLAQSCPKALDLLDMLSYLSPEAIPQKVLDALHNRTVSEALERYALLHTSQRGSSVHRLVQMVIRAQQQDKRSSALWRTMEILRTVYDNDPRTPLARQTNLQLLTHGESVLAHYDARHGDDELGGVLSDTCAWVGHLKGELGQLYAKKDLLGRALTAAENSKNPTKVTKCLNDLGLAWYGLGEYRKAIEFFERACDLAEEYYSRRETQQTIALVERALNEKNYDREHNKAMHLNNLGMAWNDLGETRKAIQYHEQALAIHEAVYGKNHQHVALCLTNLGLAMGKSGEKRKAIDYLERALAIDEKIYGQEHPHVAIVFMHLGSAWKNSGEIPKAIEFWERALAINEKIYGAEHLQVARNLSDLGVTFYHSGKMRKAVEYLERALPIFEKTYGTEHHQVSVTLHLLGRAWLDLSEVRKAIEFFERALTIDEKIHGKEHHHVGSVLNSLGVAWKDIGEFLKAIECYERALAIIEKTDGKEHPNVAACLRNLGRAWQGSGETRKAIECYERSLAVYEVCDQERSRLLLDDLGDAWQALGEVRKAVEYYERALAIDEKTHGQEFPNVTTRLNSLAASWQSLEEFRKAIDYYERVLAIDEKTYGTDHPEVATDLNNLGVAWKDIGEVLKAIEFYERALAIYEKTYGKEHPHVAICLNNLGKAWQGSGETSKAIEFYERALAIQEMYGNESSSQLLDDLGDAWQALGEVRKAVEYYERALATDEKTYGQEFPNVTTRLNSLAVSWQTLGEFRKAIEYYERVLAIDEKTYGQEHSNIAIRLISLGDAWQALGEVRKAIEYYERALAIDEKTYGEELSNVTTRLNNLGNAWQDLGEIQKAIEYYERALAIDEKTIGKEHPEIARDLNNLGSARQALGEVHQAIQCFERALAIDEKTYGKEHPDIALDLNNLGVAWHNLGEVRKAIEYFERALAIDEKIYGKEHSNVAKRLNNLGNAWQDLGEVRRALEYFEHALAIDEKTYGGELPNITTRLNSLAASWQTLGEFRKAIEYYERVVAIDEKTYGQEHLNVATDLNCVGVACHSLGEMQKAIGYFEKALAINEKTLGKEHPDLAIDLNNLGMAWLGLGEVPKAIECLQQALVINEKTHGREHPDVAINLNNLGMAWQGLGEVRKAIECFERAWAIYEKTYGKEHPDVAESLNNLEKALQALGEVRADR